MINNLRIMSETSLCKHDHPLRTYCVRAMLKESATNILIMLWHGLFHQGPISLTMSTSDKCSPKHTGHVSTNSLKVHTLVNYYSTHCVHPLDHLLNPMCFLGYLDILPTVISLMDVLPTRESNIPPTTILIFINLALFSSPFSLVVGQSFMLNWIKKLYNYII